VLSLLLLPPLLSLVHPTSARGATMSAAKSRFLTLILVSSDSGGTLVVRIL
jgi:hypothetical protein